MKIAVSMWSVHREFYENGWTLRDFLEFAFTYRIQYVELLSQFWRDRESELPIVQEALQKGLHCAAYAVGNDFAAVDPARHQKAVREVQEGIRMASLLGAPVVRVFPGNLNPGEDGRAHFERIVRGLREAAPDAAAAGVTLCLENHGKLAATSEQVRAILDAVASPHVRAALNVANFALAGQDPLAAAAELLPYVEHVHIKDIARCEDEPSWRSPAGVRYRGVPLGRGVVPLAGILAALREARYRGALSIEYEGLGDEQEGVLKSLQALSALLA